jgi:thiamine-phosphate pyrophosphorylase
MYKLICVSNRTLCTDDFAARVRDVIDAGVPVILREKDLSEDEYYRLLLKIGRQEITAHTYAGAAISFGCKKIHLPLSLLEKTDISAFDTVGASTHSAAQAAEAEKLGASYITLGHIFATDCKKGVPPRGTALIGEVRRAVKIPIYAIGGISPDNAGLAVSEGADGVCAMSGFMRCGDVREYISKYAAASL